MTAHAQSDGDRREPVAVRRERLLRLARLEDEHSAHDRRMQHDKLSRADSRVHRCRCCGAWVYGSKPCATGCGN